MEEIASVYARSLFEAAEDQDKLDEIREQLGEFADALDEADQRRLVEEALAELDFSALSGDRGR